MENYPPMDSEKRHKWTFRNMQDVHRIANSILRFIMVNERSKRWGKVIEGYKRLLWVIDQKHFPPDYEPPSSYAILLYELHFHLGLALQRQGMHRKSIQHYTQAIKAVSIPKGGCLAGCMTNSCMMTPLYSRRAFAYAQIRDLTSALRDAESAVVLDNQNPDVYCIRALVRSARNEEKQALQDLDYALTFSPSHVACLVVRGAITKPLSPRDPGGPPRQNKYLAKAEKLNPEAQSYFTVDSFLHPNVLDFYDRLLLTLLVPHTITDVNLTPDKPTKKQIESNPELYRNESSRSRSPCNSVSSVSERIEPFRCGTPAPGDNVLAARRRHDYGEAVRKHNARPKTASEYMAQLERDRQRKVAEAARIASANLSNKILKTDNRSGNGASTVSGNGGGLGTKSVSICLSSLAPTGKTQQAQQSARSPNTARSRMDSTTSKGFTYQTPTNYSIPVFQPVNIAGAPRMYYRPWRGDKLPVKDVPHPKPGPPFY